MSDAPTDRVAFYVVDGSGAILRQGLCQRADAAGQGMVPDWATRTMVAAGTVLVEAAEITFTEPSGLVGKINGLTHRYDAVSATFVPIPVVVPAAASAPTLDQLKAAKADAVGVEFAGKLAAGLAYSGEAVALDDGSRANLTALAVTAGLAAAGATTWPPNYARGWVAVSGARIALATPADGTALALAAGAYYAALVQHEQDLLDALTAAADAGAVAAVDPTAGWPANS